MISYLWGIFIFFQIETDLPSSNNERTTQIERNGQRSEDVKEDTFDLTLMTSSLTSKNGQARKDTKEIKMERKEKDM